MKLSKKFVLILVEKSTKMFKQIGRGVHKMEFLINCIINRKDRESYLKTIFIHDEIVVEDRPENPRGGRRGKRFSNNDRKGRPRKAHNQTSKISDQEQDQNDDTSFDNSRSDLKNLAVSETKEMVLAIILDELILIKVRVLQMINEGIDGLETKIELHLLEKLIWKTQLKENG